MSESVRGRALIINIHTFHNGMVRESSDVDYINISRLFKDLLFDIVKSLRELTDLTAEVLRIT